MPMRSGGVPSLLPRLVWWAIGFAIFMAVLPQLVTEGLAYTHELAVQVERLAVGLTAEIERVALPVAIVAGLVAGALHFSPSVRHHQHGAVLIERAVIGLTIVAAVPTVFRLGHHWLPVLIEAIAQRLSG